MQQTVIDVMLVDDEEDFLEDVSDALLYQKQIPYSLNVVGMACNGEQALEMARELKPEIVVMDLVMPGLDGVQVADILFQQLPLIKVLVFSSYLDFKDMQSIVNAGVRGYIVKGNLRELIRGIEKVYNDEPCFPPDVVQSLFKQQFHRQPATPHQKLSVSWQDLSYREREILTLHQAGHNRQEIARRLGLNISTIKTYFRRIEKKGGFSQSLD